MLKFDICRQLDQTSYVLNRILGVKLLFMLSTNFIVNHAVLLIDAFNAFNSLAPYEYSRTFLSTPIVTLLNFC